MRMLIYGGSFNPPHIGHVDALRCASDAVKPDKILAIPAGDPPHKILSDGSPAAEERLTFCRHAFSAIPDAEVTDLEIRRAGKSYTVLTLEELCKSYPGAELFFLIGTDMLLSFESWYEFRRIVSLCTITVLPRNEGELPVLEKEALRLKEMYGANILLIRKPPLPVDSTTIRRLLPLRQGRELLPEAVYADIIRCRAYGAKPELSWLRAASQIYLKPKRVKHVLGCEEEAVRLARRWGASEESAAEAAILHDITKKLNESEQLCLCEKYGIMLSEADRLAPPILHAITGSAFARDRFGVDDSVFRAIRYHTTGCEDMTLLDKIIYLADFIEPSRCFEGVDRVRTLAYEDLDAALAAAMEMSLEHMKEAGIDPHPMTVNALRYIRKLV